MISPTMAGIPLMYGAARRRGIRALDGVDGDLYFGGPSVDRRMVLAAVESSLNEARGFARSMWARQIWCPAGNVEPRRSPVGAENDEATLRDDPAKGSDLAGAQEGIGRPRARTSGRSSRAPPKMRYVSGARGLSLGSALASTAPRLPDSSSGLGALRSDCSAPIDRASSSIH
jgi:hypothetical protein